MQTQAKPAHYGKYRGVEISVAEGDILETGVECISISGNSQGKMGGGVSGAVRGAAGAEVEQAAENLSPVRVGSAVLLPSCRLESRGVKSIAYAAVMAQPIDSTNASAVGKAVLSLLTEANRRGLRSVAIPLMGGGIGRLPAMVSATAIVEAARRFIGDDPSGRHIRRIVFCGYFKNEAVAFVRALDSLYGHPIKNSALMIVDLIDTFIGDGSLISEDDADKICNGINSLIEVAIERGLPICYVKDAHQAQDRELVYAHRHGLEAPEAISFHEKLVIHGGPLAFTVNKNTYSAFFETGLDARLKDFGVGTVILTGTQTHVCVKHSAVHAMMHGFRPVVAADCTASSTAERHAWGLEEISRYVGEVSDSSYLRNALLA
jgi:nicotinamidase-related amidase